MSRTLRLRRLLGQEEVRNRRDSQYSSAITPPRSAVFSGERSIYLGDHLRGHVDGRLAVLVEVVGEEAAVARVMRSTMMAVVAARLASGAPIESRLCTVLCRWQQVFGVEEGSLFNELGLGHGGEHLVGDQGEGAGGR